MKISGIFILALSFGLLTLSICGQPPQTVTETDCYEQLKANNYSRTIEICTAVITEKADSAPIYRSRGLAYLAIGGFENYSQAEADFRKCIELDSTDKPCHYWLGYSNGLLSNFSEENYRRDFTDNLRDDYSFSWEMTEPSTVNEMRFAYREALARNDGYSLLRLAKIENENQLLPEVKAGDILYNAYLIGIKHRSPDLLFNIAKYENEVGLIETKKAGDILQEAYNFSRFRRDAKTMMNISIYENNEHLMTTKAGDILYEAYLTAKNNRDIRTMLRVADYEAKLDLMPNINAEQVRREALYFYQ
ncbi:MAG TPA: hypothetical protein PKY82_15870 [Pyrinomonadaceae bacterium]|nr:hypothetical protein [Pyrinomonadaceae bacterium]